MTREEASQILDDYDINFDGHTAEVIAEAFDVAFRALEQEPCEDAISRKALLSKAWFVTGDDFPIEGLEYITRGMVENMPSVTPKPKTGYWLFNGYETRCSECNYKPTISGGWNYCPNCGAKMESEGKV